MWLYAVVVRRTSVAIAAVFALLLAACGDDSDLPENAVEGWFCNAGTCPLGTHCVVREPFCPDCGGWCVLDDENVCQGDQDCNLSGFGCIDGACIPVDTCSKTASTCDDGRLCFTGFAYTSMSQGICVELGDDCPGDPYDCGYGCALCVWREWDCVAPEVYPPELCGNPPD